MADPRIRIKRSAVPGKIPTPDQIPLGELALNTYEGKLFASQNVGLGTTVIAVNPWSVGVGTDTYNTYFTVGSVGIGITNPTSKLHVVGNSIITGVSTFGSSNGIGTVIVGVGDTSLLVQGNTLVTGIVTATGGFNLGISSAGTSITSGPVTALNFIGAGNTFAVNGSTVDISIAGGGSGGGTQTTARTVTSYTTTAGISTYNVTYTAGYLDVHLNGVRLNSSEFVATNGTSVTLNQSPSQDDVLDLIYYTLGIGETGPQGPAGTNFWISNVAGIHTLSNVGIGTTNPTSKLHVVGNSIITGVSTFGSSNGIGTVIVGVGATALLVQGNARITGVLSIGQGTITLDGNTGILSATSGLGFGGDPQGERVLSFHSKSGDVGYGGSNVGSGVFRVSGPAQNLSWPGLAVGLIDGPAGGSGTYGLVGGNGSYIIGENITATQRSSLGIATASSLNVSGVVTATTFSGALTGNVTGNATGLSGTPNITVGTIGATSLNVSGIVTATGGFNLGISSAGTSITSGPVKTLNFIGTGNTFAVNGSTVNISIAGGGGSVGGGGTWAVSYAGIHTTKSVGINTTNLDNAGLTGIGNSFQGLYISNGMIIVDNVLNGNHYIGTNFNGLMAGPVTIQGSLTIDGNYVVV